MFKKDRKIKITVLAILFLGFITMAFLGYSLFFKSYIQKTIMLTFRGIESGKNPDGSTFSKEQIKSEKYLASVISALNMQDITPEQLSYHIRIIPSVPEDVSTAYKSTQEASINKVEFFPNKYTIRFINSKAIKISEKDANNIITKLIEEYQNDFYAKYGNDQLSKSLINSKDIESYDYLENVTIMNSRINMLKSCADFMSTDSGFYKSSTGMTFENISLSISTLKSVDVSRIESLVNSYYITKDLNKLTKVYEYRIKQLSLQAQKKSGEADVASNLLEKVAAPDNTAVNPDGTTIVSPTQSSSIMQIAVQNDYYSYLIKKESEALTQSSNNSIQVDYFKDEIQKYITDSTPVSSKTNAKKEVEAELVSIDQQIDYWYDEYNKLVNEYLMNQIDNSIVVIG